MSPQHTAVTVLGAVLAFLALFLAYRMRRMARLDRERTEQSLEALSEWEARKVDPWQLQEDLMGRSGQRLPQVPRLHNGVVLYAALNMEELGETLEALADAIARSHGYPDVDVMRSAYSSGEGPVAAALVVGLGLRMDARHLKNSALSLRGVLEHRDIGEHLLTPEDALALFDGTTDLAVTNAGFALSCGFPGGAGYAEVQDSNLSKANPATGRIDKTVDGKWIKGPNYRKPDLLGVLAQHAPAWWHRQLLADSAPVTSAGSPVTCAPAAE